MALGSVGVPTEIVICKETSETNRKRKKFEIILQDRTTFQLNLRDFPEKLTSFQLFYINPQPCLVDDECVFNRIHDESSLLMM